MAYSTPDALASYHDLDDFDCGSASLNEWLRKHARPAQASGSARVFVTTVDETATVAGYYALAASSVEREAASERAAQGQPAQLPAVLLARLAVDRRHQGVGVGSSLIKDVLLRIVDAADLVGVRVLLVHAKDEQAKAFYLHFGFEESPTDPLHLMMLMKDLRAYIARSL